MNQKLLENNFVVVKDFISKDRANSFYEQFKEIHKKYSHEFVPHFIAGDASSLYNPWIFSELLIEKCVFMSEFLEEPVFPTYCIGRVYEKNVILKKHIDRPACEISVTLHINGDKNWPIWFTKPNKEIVSVELDKGDAVIYLGMNSTHWRDEYKGNKYMQVFLHYVKARGENRWAIFDKQKQQ